MYADEHARPLHCDAGEAWSRLRERGADPRDYAPSPLWQLRDVLDRAAGGPGFVWLVESDAAPELVLRARTRLPGTARLHLRVEPDGPGAASRLVLRSTFEPAGAAGHAYWWATVVAHRVAFARTADALARRLGQSVT